MIRSRRPRRNQQPTTQAITPHLSSKVNVQRKANSLIAFCCGGHDSCFLVLTDAFLEKVGFSLQGNELHPVKRIARAKDLRMPKSRKQPICNKLDVLVHKLTVHANQVARERIADEAALSVHGASNDAVDNLVRKLLLKHSVKHACELGVQALVA